MREPQRKAALIERGGGAPLAWLGERLQYLAVGEQTTRRFAVAIATVPPGAGPSALVRRQDHAGFYVLSGELTFSVGKRTVTLPTGSFLDIAPSTAHKFVNSGSSPAEVLTIAAPAGFDEFQFRAGFPLSGPDEPVPPVTGEDRRMISEIAPGYDIDPYPPAEAFQADPRIRLTLPGEGPMTAVAGDLYRFLCVSDDSEGRYAIWHALIPPGGGPPLHSHSREDEAFYVLDGEMTFHADGASKRLGAGGFAHLPPGIPHRFVNESGVPASMLILVAPAGLERMFEATGRRWTDPSQLPGPQNRDEIERLIAMAPQYGIKLFLDGR